MPPPPTTAPRSFVLQLWPGDETSWRCSLRDLASGERRGFASLDELAAFLANSPVAAPERSDAKSPAGHRERAGDEDGAAVTRLGSARGPSGIRADPAPRPAGRRTRGGAAPG